MEFAKNSLSKNVKELNFFNSNYFVFVGHISENIFDLNYKVGKGIGSNISGNLNDDNIIITCRPMLQMIFLPIFIIGLFLGGLIFSNSGFDQKKVGLTISLISIGIYIVSIILINRMHKNSAKRFLALIGGGTLSKL